ncbi:hypothetical protein, partial [Mycolicibacterium hassiacum]|uniref:hypothetical protein n=1 Tax=Mycolicibacterium hassiacum TaxID=46351 RepID=UPI0022EC4DB2
LAMGTSFQPAHAGQANSDVTCSCSRPNRVSKQWSFWRDEDFQPIEISEVNDYLTTRYKP